MSTLKVVLLIATTLIYGCNERADNKALAQVATATETGGKGSTLKYQIAATSDGVMIINRETGCIWKRNEFRNIVSWQPEYRVGVREDECSITTTQYLDMVNAK